MTPRPASQGDASASNSDAELLRRAQGGDDLAFDALVERYERELFGMGYFLTGQSSDAEDIVQETFLAAYEGLANFESRSSVKTWLTRILYLRAARHHRSGRIRKAAQRLQLSEASLSLLKGSSAGPTVAQEIRIDVLEVLQSLRPEFREAIVLRELDGMSYGEIAEVLAIPAGTVESRLFRARQELKLLLKDYLD
ncbi:MAG TPA: sigma-70 family RNA polymerase sigma factor [Planctomycetota bacterium]|nr:sigma-70 family RNA polymerase sigma factor [Planctomycetota bacterium]